MQEELAREIVLDVFSQVLRKPVSLIFSDLIVEKPVALQIGHVLLRRTGAVIVWHDDTPVKDIVGCVICTGDQAIFDLWKSERCTRSDR
jgi:hypothetical protein